MTKNRNDIHNKLAALKAAFATKLPDKIQEIEFTVGDGLETVESLAHKLAGSAGTHGFTNVGHTARKLELLCGSILEKSDKFSDNDINQINELIALLHEGAKNGADTLLSQPVVENTSSDEVSYEISRNGNNSIILVDDDVEQSAILEQLLSNFGFSVLVLNHPKYLKKAVKKQQPSAVIMDIIFPDDPDAGLTAIKTLRDENILKCPVIFISVREDFQARLEATRCGANGYVVKPINIIEIVETLHRLIEASERPALRVLIVDDDPEITDFCKLVLENGGLETSAINDPMLAVNELEKFKPDVIILDIKMPECDGFDLASTIRQMGDRYLQVPILFLTAHTEFENKMRAAETGSEDFISKPVDPDFLLTSVTSRAERSRTLKGLFQRMKAGEEKFYSITQSANDAIVSTNDRGLVLSWNDGAREIFGYQSREILGKPVSLLIPEKYREAHEDGMKRVREGGKAKVIGKTVELQGLRKDGSEFPLELSLSSWVAENEVFFAATIRNISERKEAETELDRQRVLFESVFQDVPDAMIIADTNRQITMCNPALTKVFGYNQDEIKGLTTSVLYTSEEDYEEQGRVRYSLSAEEKLQSYVSNYKRKNGEVFPAETVGSMIKDRNGNHLGFIGVIRDITEKVKSERELNFQKFALDEHAIVSFTDVKGNITYANNKFCTISGYSRDELIGQNHKLLKSDEHPREFYTDLWKTISNGDVWRGNIKNQSKDGSYYWVDGTIVPFLNDQGKPFQYVAIRTDITERIKIEQNLRSSQHLMSNLLDNTHEGFWHIDNDLCTIKVNSAMCAILDQNEDEILRKSIFEFVDDENAKVFREQIKKRQKGETGAYEIALQRPDGTNVFCINNGTPVFDEKGVKTGSIGQWTDITERRNAEFEVRESETRFRSLFDQSPIGISLEDYSSAKVKIDLLINAGIKDFHQYFTEHKDELKEIVESIEILDANAALVSMFGYKSYEGYLKFENDFGIWENTNWKEYYTNELTAFISKTSSYSGNFKAFRNDGSPITLKCTTVIAKGHEDDWSKIITSQEDLTEKEAAEQSVRDSQKLLQNAIESIGDAFVLFDADDRLVIANEKYRQYYEGIRDFIVPGVSFEKLLRECVKKEMFPEAVGREKEWIETRMEQHRVGDLTVEQRLADGRWLKIVEHTTENGGIAGIRVDVTKLKNIQEAAEKANLAKSEFLSSMSHELRTPMNAILGFAQMLEFNPHEPLSEIQKGSVDHILKGGNHLLDLINDVLDLAKIEAGKAELSIEDIDLNIIVDECLSLTTGMAEDRGINISVPDIKEKLPRLKADYTRTKQVLLNLISNAVKYNRDNGKVTISSEATDSNSLRVTVSDTGPGIPKNRQGELFQAFSRLEAANSEIEGTGIGLVVSKDLVELMGGTIGFESEDDKGSTFWFELPLATLQSAGMNEQDAIVAAEESGQLINISGTMLYVEDNPSNLQLMEMIVSRIDGLTMLSAHTAELGIEIAKSKQPDIIVLDINLPGMSGLDAVKELKRHNTLKNTPVMALSAAATKSDIEKGIKAGFDHYMTKPMNVVEVMNAIREALEGLEQKNIGAVTK